MSVEASKVASYTIYTYSVYYNYVTLMLATVVSAAIHRYYEYRCRMHVDNQPQRKHAVSDNQRNTQREGTPKEGITF